MLIILNEFVNFGYNGVLILIINYYLLVINLEIVVKILGIMNWRVRFEIIVESWFFEIMGD